MEERGHRKVRTGKVTSNKMDKTITVKVTRRFKHRTYKKYVVRDSSFKAHDENNECQIGDTVMIRECRPLSKEKRWRLAEIKERAKV
jgi:small subunit ribosomal protein S17